MPWPQRVGIGPRGRSGWTRPAIPGSAARGEITGVTCVQLVAARNLQNTDDNVQEFSIFFSKTLRAQTADIAS